jgi:exopolysaccharide production protein ExoQ
LETLEHTAYYGTIGKSASRVAKASFLIFLFFLFFGTTLPFQESSRNIEDIGTENPFKQIVFSSLYFVSLLGLLPKKTEAIWVFRKEKYLLLFLLWSLLTVFWSDFPLTSFKRWFQLAGVVIIFVSALVHFESENQAWSYVRAVLVAYISLSLLSIMLIPGAIQWEFPAWRGLASHKNTLGQISLLSLTVWSVTAFEQDTGKKIFSLAFIGLSFILLAGSRSTTSILTCCMLMILASILYLEKRFVRPVVGHSFSSLLIFSFFAYFFLLLFFTPSSIDSLFELFGKDTSFTGRVDIWVSIFEEIKNHWILGCGFQGFWMTKKPVLDSIYYDLEWQMPHAHQGYLDILNETGIIGLSLFLSMMLSYFKDLWRSEKSYSWSWIVIGVLVLNLTETTLFRSDDVSWALLLFAYLTFYVDQSRTDPDVPQHESSPNPDYVHAEELHPPAAPG